MNWISLIWEFGPWLLAGVGFLLSYVFGRKARKAKDAEEAWERMFKQEEKGRHAVQEARKSAYIDSDDDLVKRMRKRDADWGGM